MSDDKSRHNIPSRGKETEEEIKAMLERGYFRISIHFEDPDATDSSSDEAPVLPRKSKTALWTPNDTFFKLRKKTPEEQSTSSSSSIYKGVRRLENGHYIAEIEDPLTETMFTATFPTEYEAARGYLLKEEEFEFDLERYQSCNKIPAKRPRGDNDDDSNIGGSTNRTRSTLEKFTPQV